MYVATVATCVAHAYRYHDISTGSYTHKTYILLLIIIICISPSSCIYLKKILFNHRLVYQPQPAVRWCPGWLYRHRQYLTFEKKIINMFINIIFSLFASGLLKRHTHISILSLPQLFSDS
jgi:hypothetical protein